MLAADNHSGMILGLVASSGIALGPAHLMHDAGGILVPRRTVEDKDVDQEVKRFDAATREAEQALLALQQDVCRRIGRSEAEIFAAQIMFVQDSALRNEVVGRCRSERINAEAAVVAAIEKLAAKFLQIQGAYFQEKASDMLDVGKRILDVLLKCQQAQKLNPPEGTIVVATELLPSTTARMNLGPVRGLVLEKGSQTLHAAILTRSLGIPSVVQVTDALKRFNSGDQILLDGLAGRVFINPPKAILRE